MRSIALCLALTLLLACGEVAGQGSRPGRPAGHKILPERHPGETAPVIARRYNEYFARVGEARGSGFRQFMRWQQLVAPRSYPSGNLVNFTALTWANHFSAVRSPEFQSRRKAAVAAGIGTGNWRLIGPAQAMRAPEGGDIGRINVIAIHPTDSATIYIGTPAGGLWRTRDEGANWASLTDGLPLIGITDIAIDPSTPATLYLLTGDGEGRERSHGPPSIGVLKSVDGGLHWLPTGLVWKSDQNEYGHRLIIHPNNPAVLLVAGTAGLFRTSNGGETWTRVAAATRDNPFWDIQFHPADPSVLYAASTTDVHRSTDVGESWTRLDGGLPRFAEDAQVRQLDPNSSNRIRLAVSPARADTLYVLYGSNSGFTIGLYRSDDRGDTFSKRSSTNPLSQDSQAPLPIDLTKPNILGYDPNDFESQSDYDLAMAVSPTDIERVHVGGVDVWRSEDGGRTWKQTSRWAAEGAVDYVHADIHALQYRDAVLYAGTDGGIYRSTNGGDTWASIANMATGIAIAQVYAVCATPQDPNLMFYGAQDNGTYRLRLDGEATKVDGADGFVCQINPRDSRIVYDSVYYGNIGISEDGGQNFKRRIRPRAGGVPVRGAWLTPYILGPTDPDSIYACYTDLWLSPYRGFSWKNLTNGALGASRQCAQVAVAPSDVKTIYVAKQAEWDATHFMIGDVRPPFLGGGGVFRSDDGGATWQIITGTLPLADAAITNMAVSPTDPRRAWVTFSGYAAEAKVFGTTDGGATWNNLSAGLPNLPVNAIAARAGVANGFYVGLDSGVYYRDDNLDGWVPFVDGLPNVIVTALLIDEARQRVIAATYGRGIWQSEIPCSENCSPSPPPGIGSPGARPLAAPSVLSAQPSGSYVGPVDIFR